MLHCHARHQGTLSALRLLRAVLALRPLRTADTTVGAPVVSPPLC
jgi:hypothetical protein